MTCQLTALLHCTLCVVLHLLADIIKNMHHTVCTYEAFNSVQYLG